MKTVSSAQRKSLAWLWVLYCLAMAFCFTGCSEKAQLLHTFSELEKEALEYGTVSVGAARVTDYNNGHLKYARKQLSTALKNFRTELGGDPNISRRGLSDAAVLSKPLLKADGKVPGQTPLPSEIELVGLRMAALKFIESELEDLNLDCISITDPNSRRLEISLDCSAWVRGKAGAALVYIDLYPYKADDWCHRAAEVFKKPLSIGNKTVYIVQKPDPQTWYTLMNEELGCGFLSLDSSITEPPDEKRLMKEDPNDLVGFCHRWLGEKNLLPRIVHVERMGKAEYLVWAESDYSKSEFGISAAYPAGVTTKLGFEDRKEAKRQLASVRPLSLAFVAGDRRAGWLFMPGKTTEGRMAPTERRLRMVVDIPNKMSRLTIHVHKTFLDPDLGILSGAGFKERMANLERTKNALIKADDLYEQNRQTDPKHYRLIKTRIRNLLYQCWAEEIVVNIPKTERKDNIRCP